MMHTYIHIYTYIHTYIHKNKIKIKKTPKILSKTFFKISKPRPSLLLVREFSFPSIAFFLSFHFSVFKSVQYWKFRKIAVGKFSVAPDLNLSCLLYQNQLLQQFSHWFISLLINFQAPNGLPHRHPIPNGLLSLQKVL
jgi:hypothetical protein